MGHMPVRRLAVLSLSLAALVACAPAAHAAKDAASLLKAVESLDADLTGSLSASARLAVHRKKRLLIADHFLVAIRGTGTGYGTVLLDLDCVSVSVQRARQSAAKAKSLAAQAKGCLTDLGRQLADGSTPPAALVSDLGKLSKALAAIAARIKQKRVFGVKATDLRKQTASFVRKHFTGKPIGGVPFPDAFETLECVDVKVESGAIKGASACATRLRRMLRENLPPSQGGTNDQPSGPPITFGSDLTGDPVAITGKYPEDSAFWTKGVVVPADGLVKTFRLKVGSLPVEVPIRFSIARPEPDGRVKVITTSDPPFRIAARTPKTYTFDTSVLSFKCCNARKGDVVAVTSSGADQTEDPFVWFTRKPEFTTFSHVNPMPGSHDQDPGVVWSFQANEGLETLLQIIVSPN